METKNTTPKTREKVLKSDKNQSVILVGIAMIAIGIIFVFIALNQPKVSLNVSETESSVPSISFDSTASENISTENAPANTVINLNTCSADDLIQLKGVGESKAQSIIAYRSVLGGYTSTEQIKEINGISDNLYDSIKDYLTV